MEHTLLYHKLENGSWWSSCSCGAKWSQPVNSTWEHLDSIFASHVSYSKHELIKVL